MRIIHAVRSDGYAGVEAHVQQLAIAQHRAGNVVWVIGGDRARMTALADAGVPHLPARSTFDVARRLARLRGVRPQIIHAHMTAAEIGASVVPSSARIVTTRHFAARRGGSGVRRIALHPIQRRISAEISVSRCVADAICTPSSTIYPGLATAPDRVMPDSGVILLAQRLEPEKASAVGLRAFAASGLQRSGWRLRIAGDGSERASLSALAAHLQADGAVDFLGHRSDLSEQMNLATMLLAPCACDALGLTVLEAMAAGLPVVAAAAAGHLETLGPVTADSLFPPHDAQRAGQILASLATDADRLERIAHALQARQREDFTIDRQVEEIDRVYRSVL